MDEVGIQTLLARDLSVGTERFREALLSSCLALVGADEAQGELLDDEELEMLAAAGTPEEALDPDNED